MLIKINLPLLQLSQSEQATATTRPSRMGFEVVIVKIRNTKLAAAAIRYCLVGKVLLNWVASATSSEGRIGFARKVIFSPS